ncbi:hypothetical protein LLE49_10385 [Alicyclobacillus tolerans]|uniref:hypothetical protein n=1 Tax=Alicyclobacillus tolerans TaxID=90970 RepID=UPI003558A93A|nr:hypothetical protein [Alicyclobacillus tolerans]
MESVIDEQGTRASVHTICSFCGTGCGLVVTTENGRIVQVAGDKESPVSRGETCVKGTQAWGFVQSRQRLTRPLVRSSAKTASCSLHPGRKRWV